MTYSHALDLLRWWAGTVGAGRYSLKEMAWCVRLPYRTLQSRLRRAGVAQPSAVLRCYRAMHAIALMRTGATVTDAAFIVGYTTCSDLLRLLRTTIGFNWRDQVELPRLRAAA